MQAPSTTSSNLPTSPCEAITYCLLRPFKSCISWFHHSSLLLLLQPWPVTGYIILLAFFFLTKSNWNIRFELIAKWFFFFFGFFFFGYVNVKQIKNWMEPEPISSIAIRFVGLFNSWGKLIVPNLHEKLIIVKLLL